MLSFGSYSNAGRRSKAVLEVSSFLRGISARTQSRRRPITTGRIIFLGQEVVLRLEYCFVSIRRPTSPCPGGPRTGAGGPAYGNKTIFQPQNYLLSQENDPPSSNGLSPALCTGRNTTQERRNL